MMGTSSKRLGSEYETGGGPSKTPRTEVDVKDEAREVVQQQQEKSFSVDRKAILDASLQWRRFRLDNNSQETSDRVLNDFLHNNSPTTTFFVKDKDKKQLRVSEALKRLGIGMENVKVLSHLPEIGVAGIIGNNYINCDGRAPLVTEDWGGMTGMDITGQGQCQPFSMESHATGNLTSGNRIGQDAHYEECNLKGLASFNLQQESLRQLQLDISNLELAEIPPALEKLYLSLPAESLEKRLGLMAVKIEKFKEIAFRTFFSRCATGNYRPMHVDEVSFVGVDNNINNLIQARRMGRCDRDDAATKPSKVVLTTLLKMEENQEARRQLWKLESIFYGHAEYLKNRFLDIIKNTERTPGFEDRVTDLIDFIQNAKKGKLKRTVSMGGIPSSDLFSHKGSARNLDLDMGGIGWENSFETAINISLAGGKQVWFAYLLTEKESVKDMVKKELDYFRCVKVGAKDANFPTDDDSKAAPLPKLLRDGEFSYFPIVQKPGMIIYRHNPQHTIAKLRLGNGADVAFQAEDLNRPAQPLTKPKGFFK